ncbi:MAG: hypothetical protein M1834_001778 [Cirrosporium novae-zelandiae]|nr:MAG: hypothetical protein M1834_001778 [Cirrosporium novae-zelandiae]
MPSQTTSVTPRLAPSEVKKSSRYSKIGLLLNKGEPDVPDVPKELLQEPLVIRPYPSSPYQKPLTLIPILLIPRSDLPLFSLDLTNSIPGAFSSNLFSAHIPPLEEEIESRRTRPVVFIARNTAETSTFAIEWVQEGVYSLCKLWDWVDIKALGKPSSTTQNEAILGAPVPNNGGCQEWWASAAIGPEVLQNLRSEKAKTISFPLSLSMEPPETETAPTPIQSASPSETATIEAQIQSVPKTLQDTQEELQGIPNLRPATEEYMEALYMSKTPLSYFVKGPLSRTRVGLGGTEGSSNAITNLIDVLRDRIIPLNRMDTKYKDAIPQVIRNSCMHSNLEDDSSHPSKKKKRRRAAKLGKNGLFPDEEDYIRRWWQGRESVDPDISKPTPIEDEVKILIGDLRKRETQLQIILVLEVLALEQSYREAQNENGGTEQQNQEPETQSNTKKKNKKPQDLKTLLDLLVDRLCIWQSVDIDNVGSATPKFLGQALQKAQDSSDVKNSTALRDFCMEVIVPFYASRLPDQCRTISQKLHPATESPPKPKRPHLHRSATTAGIVARPGEPVTRHHRAAQQKRTLQRVLTDEKYALRQRSTSLARTTSDVTALMKRESSEIPLSSVASFSRGGIQTAAKRHHNNREVDLTAVSQAVEAKLKRRAAVESQKTELENAINALKKPHRALVAKEFADTVEKRAGAPSHTSRKSKNPVRNPLGLGVEVMATPSGQNRKRDVLSSAVREMTPTPDESPLIPSSGIKVPSSSMRPAFSGRQSSFESMRGWISKSATKKGMSSIDDTPTKCHSKFIDIEKLGENLFSKSLPLTSSINTSRASFKKPKLPLQRSSGNKTKSFSSVFSINDTPTKKRSLEDGDETLVTVTPAKKRMSSIGIGSNPKVNISSKSNGDEDSIYAALGWNDDMDELL